MTTIVDMISNNKTKSIFVKEDNVNLLWKIIINTPAFKKTIRVWSRTTKVEIILYSTC